MSFIADLHVHSHFSRATSHDLDLEHLHEWAQKKGISVVGTGDFTHPQWQAELSAKLEEAETGLYRLSPALSSVVDQTVPQQCAGPVRFLLQAEISCIYKWGNRTRKVHNLVLAPDLPTAARITSALGKIGNLRADGRPILGLDSKILLEIVKEASAQAEIIPAHIWTPWFSVLGSFSGFDSIEECFREMTPHIFAVETGLSSDPQMNWRLSHLDRFALVSNSDAHSVRNLGREATIFSCELSYAAMITALKTRQGLLGTLEFFPEEGKYHYDGHLKCHVRLSPQETKTLGGVCPVCHKPLTIGVLHRVEELADRPLGARPSHARSYECLVALGSILGELLATGAQTKRVAQESQRLLDHFGPELRILREAPLDELDRYPLPLLRTAIERVRNGQVLVEPGFDGEYGVIKVFEPGERERLLPQKTFFADTAVKPKTDQLALRPKVQHAAVEVEEMVLFMPIEPEPTQLATLKTPTASTESLTADAAGGQLDLFKRLPESAVPSIDALLAELNPVQREAVAHEDGPLLIIAGPGTGKTRTLTIRIAYHVLSCRRQPQNVLALTFSNRAADEMRSRLLQLLGSQATTEQIFIGTFHSFAVSLLRSYRDLRGERQDFFILDEEARLMVIERLLPKATRRKSARAVGEVLSRFKAEPISAASLEALPPELQELQALYRLELQRLGAYDFDELLLAALELLSDHAPLRETLRTKYSLIAIDEYQDINRVQYQLIKLCAGDGKNLCAIGDPDQAIYNFRGSDPSFFSSFAADFPGARVVHLNQSYRSTDTIVRASRNLFGPAGGPLHALIPGGARVTIHAARSDKAEAEYAVKTIEQLIGGATFFSMDSGRVDSGDAGALGFGDIAILYRLHALGDAHEEAFSRSGMPFVRMGNQGLFSEPLPILILTLLRTLQYPRNETDLLRLMQSTMSTVEPATISFLSDFCRASSRTLAETMQAPEIVAQLPLAQQGALQELLDHVETARQALATSPPQLLMHRLAGFFKHTPDEKSESALKRLQEHFNACRGSIPNFLHSLALRTETDDFMPGASRISLMTIHAAKGLEFPLVFLTGCEEGVLPYHRFGTLSDSELAEEKRLLYVGMTRAKSLLYLSYAERRQLGKRQLQQQPSRFLAEIRDELIRREKSTYRKPIKPEDKQLKLF